MTWTAPATATTGQVVTAAFWNAQVRDNLLETSAATAQAAGDLMYADAANSMGSRLAHPGVSRMLVSAASNGLVWRQPVEAINYSDGSTSGVDNNVASFVRIWDSSGEVITLPNVAVATGTGAVVIVSARFVANSNAGASVLLSYSVSGATTQAASDGVSVEEISDSANQRGSATLVKWQALTAGTNTFHMEARVSGGNGTIVNPRILVIPL